MENGGQKVSVFLIIPTEALLKHLETIIMYMSFYYYWVPEVFASECESLKFLYRKYDLISAN